MHSGLFSKYLFHPETFSFSSDALSSKRIGMKQILGKKSTVPWRRELFLKEGICSESFIRGQSKLSLFMSLHLGKSIKKMTDVKCIQDFLRGKFTRKFIFIFFSTDFCSVHFLTFRRWCKWPGKFDQFDKYCHGKLLPKLDGKGSLDRLDSSWKHGEAELAQLDLDGFFGLASLCLFWPCFSFV